MNNLDILKFNLEGVSFSVIIDDAFAKAKNVSHSIEAFHFHHICDMYFVYDNEFRLHLIGDKVNYSNCIITVPPQVEHYSMKNDDTFFFLFDIKKNKDCANSTLYDFFHNKLFKQNKPVILQNNEIIRFYLYRLKEAIEYSPNEEKYISLLKLIFLTIYENNNQTQKDSHPSRENVNIDYIYELEYILHSKYKEDIKLTDVAEFLHLSTKQVSRIIKKHYNDSLSSLLRQRRLNVAKKLLITTNKSIAEIIEQINYPSASHFYEDFKKHFDTTPDKFRKDFYNDKY